MDDFEIGFPNTTTDFLWTAIVILSLLLAGMVLIFLSYQNGAIGKGIREVYQRLRAPMPTFFKRFFWVGVTFIATYGPVILEKFKVAQLPSWVNPETAEDIAIYGSGIVSAAIFAVNYRKTDPKKIPDVKSPIDVVIEVPAEKTTTIKPISPNINVRPSQKYGFRPKATPTHQNHPDIKITENTLEDGSV